MICLKFQVEQQLYLYLYLIYYQDMVVVMMINVVVQVLKIVESQNVLPLELLIIIQHNQMYQEVPDKNLTQILKLMPQLLQTLVVLQFQLSNSAVILLSTKNSNFQEALSLTRLTLSQVAKVKVSAQMVASLLLNNILLN